MSQTSPPKVEQCPADLKALHRQLEEIAKRANQTDRPDRDRHGAPGRADDCSAGKILDGFE